MKNVLYIHGMGGGSDSRIPSILSEVFAGTLNVVTRTYSFDPEVAARQISSWVDELNPDLVIGESLGALHAMRVTGVPHIFVSPALNATFYLRLLSWLSVIPGITWLFDRIYRPREGDRQPLHFTREVLKKYPDHRKAAIANSSSEGSQDSFYAFFGTRDHYRKSGIVSIRTWKRYFGDTCTIYDGTHFMEEKYVRTILAERIREMVFFK